MIALDTPTLLFAFAMLSLLMAGVTFVQAIAIPRRGLEIWSGAMLCCAAAYGLYSFRGQAPALLTFVLPNGMALAAGACAVWAYARLMRERPPWRSLLVGALVAIASLLTTHRLAGDAAIASMITSCVLSLDMILIGRLLARSGSNMPRELHWMALGATGLMALAFAIRAGLFGLDLHQPMQTLSEPVDAPLVAISVATLAFLLSTMAFIGLAAERKRHEAVDHLRRDSLTGFLTRTAFSHMEDELERQTRETGCAVLMVDLDHFKRINDSHGRDGGDRVLAHAARLMANTIRLSDQAIRYGGEEFCIVLRACGESDADQFAQRLLSLANQQRVRMRDQQMVGFTLSIGVAVRRQGIDSETPTEGMADLIRRANLALYQAKRSGRNRRVMSSKALNGT